MRDFVRLRILRFRQFSQLMLQRTVRLIALIKKEELLPAQLLQTEESRDWGEAGSDGSKQECYAVVLDSLFEPVVEGEPCVVEVLRQKKKLGFGANVFPYTKEDVEEVVTLYSPRYGMCAAFENAFFAEDPPDEEEKRRRRPLSRSVNTSARRGLPRQMSRKMQPSCIKRLQSLPSSSRHAS